MKKEKYIVLNRTRDIRLGEDVESAKSIFRRMMGLIGRSARSFTSGKGLWIFPCNGIHTLGMRMPIDVAYLDSKGKVLRLYHELPPYRIGAVKYKARSVLELPSGTLVQTNTQVGDIIEFQMKEYRSE